jgi:hypothetical protein
MFKNPVHTSKKTQCFSVGFEVLTAHYKDQLVNAIREVITLYSENCMIPVDTLGGQNTEFVNIKPSGTYTYH